MQRVDNNAFIQKYGAMIVLVFIVVINMFITPNFTQINTFWNIIIQAFPVIIVSIGMTLVISTGGIDISVGSTVAIAAIVFAKMLVLNGMSLGVSIIIAMVACTAFGMINGFLIGMFRVQPIVATLILMISGRGIAQQLNDGAVISFYGNPYVDIGLYRIGGQIPVQVPIVIILVAIAIFIVRKTAFGIYLQAVGDNHKASFVSGINTKFVIVLVYTICAFLAGLSALFECLRTGAADPTNLGNGMELDCIAAVTVGGTSMTGGKALMFGTVIGALVMQLITTMVNMNDIHYTYSLLVKAAVIIVALYLQNRKAGI